jgi:hypothetical protein
VVVFGEDGTPRVLSPRGSFWRTRVSRPLEATLALTFRPVIERAGGAWRPPAINPLRVLVVVALGLWLVAMAALATGLLHE